jgi:Baseplate J-like protein
MTRYSCGTERRRQRVSSHPTLNGIDFLEVDEAQRERLYVTLFKPPSVALTPDQIRIGGGDTVRSLRVLTVTAIGATLTIDLDTQGDFSNYTLRLVESATSDATPAGYDPRLSSIDFSFKAGCPTGFDCRTADECLPETGPQPDIDYQARDFESFRRLMLDRMRLLAPEWRETIVADVMHALVDLKAYVADYQAYQQDAVATEAYLHTARRRISVKRHARLLDYHVHEGASARAWVQVVVDPAAGAGGIEVPARSVLFTETPDTADRLSDPADVRAALQTGPEVFETTEAVTAYASHNRMLFYTWGDEDCCLPRGATAATLLGEFPRLRPGDVLVLEEVRGAETGAQADADRARRQAVCLISVERAEDPITTPATVVTNIAWHPRDAVRFPLCVAERPPAGAVRDPWSGRDRTDPEGAAAISVARGNIVVVDHGRTVADEALEAVTARDLRYADGTLVPIRFNPVLLQAPVSRTIALRPVVQLPLTSELADPLDAGKVPRALRRAIEARRVLAAPLSVSDYGPVWVATSGPVIYELVPGADGILRAYERAAAADRMHIEPAVAEAAIALQTTAGVVWSLVPSLLASAPDAPDFVAETEEDGSARVRFPSGLEAGTEFRATYRVGRGPSGNVGVEAIRHIVSSDGAILRVRNPMAATGGELPESIEHVRQSAPFAYRQQERAVTERDYADVALRHPGVQRAVATFRWTGSWFTVFVNVDRQGGGEVDEPFEREMRALFERYRMAGTDVEIESPVYVPLELALEVCVRPDYLRSDVERALMRALSNGDNPDGTRGAFHPDNFSFEQPVYLSPIVAAAQHVPGVESVTATRFNRQDAPGVSGIGAGQLTMGRLEIARLDNDRNYPERGRFSLSLHGGK